MSTARRRLVVVGGGISGLAAAWAAVQAAVRDSARDSARDASRAPDGIEVLLLERESGAGGKARSIRRDGWLVECGPSSYLPGDGAVEALAASVGMTGEIIEADPVARRRYIHIDGRMREVASSPVGLVRAGLLTARGAARLCIEPFVPRVRDGEDESVWAFAARRLGAQVADRLVLPAALGVFAGDAKRLSMRAAFPRMARLERVHGSLLRGMIAGRRASATPPDRRGPLSFRDGMQSLPRALAERGGFDLRFGCAVTSLEREGGRWRVAVEGDAPIVADAVILSSGAVHTAHLLRSHAPAASVALREIRSPGIAVVSLGFGPEARARIPRGFGVLIARGEGYRMLGNIFESQLFPRRAPEGHTLLRVMLGGATDERALDLADDDLAELARREVAQLYGLRVPPVFEHVTRAPSAIPQYEIGHEARIERLERAMAPLLGITLTGFALRGVAFPDAAADGIRVGDRAWQSSAHRSL